MYPFRKGGATMKYNTIAFEKEDHVAIITLNRPEKLNAVTRMMIDELKEALENVAIDDKVRVLIVTGAGRGFCAGADLKASGSEAEIGEGATPEEQRQTIRHGLQEVSLRLHRLSIPTIAMINGVATGLGFDWALACDLRIGSENARFRVSFTKVGAIPGGGGTWLMPKVIGMPKAAELIFTGDFLEAKEAEKIGVLNKLVPAEDLERETLSMARRIAENPPIAIRLSKLQLRKGLEVNLESALDMIAGCQTICLASEDYKEGVAAFREKREPKFQGR